MDGFITIMTLIFLLWVLKAIFFFFRTAANEVNYKSSGPGVENGGYFSGKDGKFYADQRGL